MPNIHLYITRQNCQKSPFVFWDLKAGVAISDVHIREVLSFAKWHFHWYIRTRSDRTRTGGYCSPTDIIQIWFPFSWRKKLKRDGHWGQSDISFKGNAKNWTSTLKQKINSQPRWSDSHTSVEWASGQGETVRGREESLPKCIPTWSGVNPCLITSTEPRQMSSKCQSLGTWATEASLPTLVTVMSYKTANFCCC